MENINFTLCPNGGKIYGGSMLKKSIIYNGDFYMLKFQEKALTHYSDFSKTYINSIFSEYIASNIAKSIDLEVHSTLLGIFETSEKIYNVVACKDFLKENERLITFKDIFNNTRLNHANLEIKSINGTLKTIELQKDFDSEVLKNHFWEMFVFDGYIGNFDRNPTNWGIVENIKTGNKKIAPIFDNGSCLHPKTPRKLINQYLNDIKMIEDKAIFMPTMTFRKNENNVRIKYHQFFETSENETFLKAIYILAPKIINKHKENIKFISNLNMLEKERKELLIKELDLRLNQIIIPTYHRAKNFLNNNFELKKMKLI